MSDNMGTIKFVDSDRIITKKDGLTQIWSRFSGDSSRYIVWSGFIYKLLKEVPFHEMN